MTTIIHCLICLLLLRCLLQIKYPTMTDKTILRRFIHHLYLFRSMTIPIIPRVTIIDQQVPFNLFENKNMIVILRKVSKYVEQYGTNPPFPEPRRIRTNYKQRMDTVKHGMDEIIYRSGWIQILVDESRRDRIGRAMFMLQTTDCTFIELIQEQRCEGAGKAEYLVELSQGIVDPYVARGITFEGSESDSCNKMKRYRNLMTAIYPNSINLGGALHWMQNTAKRVEDELIILVVGMCQRLHNIITGHAFGMVIGILGLADNATWGRGISTNSLEFAKEANLLNWFNTNRRKIQIVIQHQSMIPLIDLDVRTWFEDWINWVRIYACVIYFQPIRISTLNLLKDDAALSDVYDCRRRFNDRYDWRPVLENHQHLHDQLYSDHPPIISTKLFADIYPHDDVACDLKDFENDRSFVLYQFPDLVSSSKEEMYPPTDDEGMEELIELKEMESKPMPTNNMIDTTTEDAVKTIKDLNIAHGFAPIGQDLSDYDICIELDCAACKADPNDIPDNLDPSEQSGHYRLFAGDGIYLL
eukprot:404271_1